MQPSRHWLWLVTLLSGLAPNALSQDGADKKGATAGSSRIIIQTEGQPVEPPLFYRSKARAQVTVGARRIEQVVNIQSQVIQGEADEIAFSLHGAGTVTDVSGEQITSWSIRQTDAERFLDIQLVPGTRELKAKLTLQLELEKLPATVELTNLGAGDSVGFDSIIAIDYAPGISGKLIEVDGFVPLDSKGESDQLQSATGGKIKLLITGRGGLVDAVELTDTQLTGELHPNGRSVHFTLQASAIVREEQSRLALLSGNAAVSQYPEDTEYRLLLSQQQTSLVYELAFQRPGTYPIKLEFVAAVHTPDADWRNLDFTVAASAVVPITLTGFEPELEFVRSPETVVPIRSGSAWEGFLPANGRFKMQWKNARAAGESKLFFTTRAQIDTTVGPGLLRQQHVIEYQILQGELDSLSLILHGPGEVLNVSGENIVGWQVKSDQDVRRLEITLNQPLVDLSQLQVTSQTAVGAFPVRVEALRLEPSGALRHAGQLRIRNVGSVRIDPTGLEGLAQLAPDQFVGEQVEARQAFVYRFPAAEYDYTIVADRIQPEVNISELLIYRLSESDRTITAEVEMDIREAPIREWDFQIPDDYSVIAVSGANLADYVAASQAENRYRNLKVIFKAEAQGRQLISLQLEKNETAAASDWTLPQIAHPNAKTVRGNVGIAAAAGFRLSTSTTESLSEQPLSYFPKQVSNLQQAFRIRQPDWTATLSIEQLEGSIQADIFHLYSLSQGTVYGSALINFFVTGAPASEWRIACPADLGNVMVDGQDVRTWRREDDTLIISLHQPVMGPYTLLITFEEKPDEADRSFQPGVITPLNVQGDRGYIQVVSPMQVELQPLVESSELLVLDALELPGEFRLLSTAPALGTWQYTERPFELKLEVTWFQPGSTASQVVEFSEANSRVSPDGELVTDIVYFVKSRGQQTLRLKLPEDPVRLWAVSVDGQPVTARQAGEETLIPLPGSSDPNAAVEVSIHLGKPAVEAESPELTLPVVLTPVLKTQWNVLGDENHVLVPSGGNVDPAAPAPRPTGFQWLAKTGLTTTALIGVLTLIAVVIVGQGNVLRLLGLLLLVGASVASGWTAWQLFEQITPPAGLQLSLPVLAAGEVVSLQVDNVEAWLVNFSGIGMGLVSAGILALACSFAAPVATAKGWLRMLGFALISGGIMMQGDGAAWFFGFLTVVLVGLIFVPVLVRTLADLKTWWIERMRQDRSSESANPKTESGGAVVTSILALLATSSVFVCQTSIAADDGTKAAGELVQQWQISHQEASLKAAGKLNLSGQPGDQFVLLRAPAVLTKFEAKGLRLSKFKQTDGAVTYIVTIPNANPDSTPATGEQEAEENNEQLDTSENKEESAIETKTYTANFEYQLEAIDPVEGLPVLTGPAAVQVLNLVYDQSGWDVRCATAARVEMVDGADATQAKILLGPGDAQIFLRPQARDLSSEDTQFFVESSNLYIPGPGVIDGLHRINVRTSQGKVNELSVSVPDGLTVSEVQGPIAAWRFDAEIQQLNVEIEASADSNFSIEIATQRGWEPLPAEIELVPLRVQGPEGEVGLIAIAFGPDAQPERVEAEGMSLVNLDDFDATLLKHREGVIHRVYRYGAEDGSLSVRAAPVAPEIRVLTRQILSLGDERIVLAINFSAEITRAGIFQLSFTLPDGLEVESLTGDALHHWSELSEGEQRQVIMHLNGKTLATHGFSLTLAGVAPADTGEWTVPRFEIQEAARQTGELVVRPITGIRLRTVSRQNVSEIDPRELGGQGPGALAFRLLQREWDLVLGIEKLDPWVRGQILHEVTIREGQTRSTLLAEFDIQNASIRTLRVSLPITDEDELKTVRATGPAISDLVRSSPDSDVWEIQFKRRVIGQTQFQLEFERRGDRAIASEDVTPLSFPDVRELTYYVSVRAGGRLEIEADSLEEGWQKIDWNSVPESLRDAGNRNAPALALRAMATTTPLRLQAVRHSLADALKLRVASGTLTTVLSPTGDQLTAVDVTVEVIQRSSLSVELPDGGALFSIFVNGESVHSIRQNDNPDAWQFYILPGIDDRTANVRFVYSLKGDGLTNLALASPKLNAPLENVEWNVIAPKGFQLIENDGNLELAGKDIRESYDRVSYLSKASGKRQDQAQQATKLLEQANELLQKGQQNKARWALNSVANQYALDAASNEDARVQLENLQTQQAVVGLNTRRQRLYLDNNRHSEAMMPNEQMEQAALINPILQQGQLNFRPQQLSQLLAGNSNEDNAVLQQIAGRLVRHQRTIEPAPQAILISLPEEGTVYRFSRSVQVSEKTPLRLDLRFESQYELQKWQWIVVAGVLLALAFSVGFPLRKAIDR